jgi:hypothetical protein
VASPKTELTEIVTGLGMSGGGSIDEALQAMPSSMRHVTDDVWQRLSATCAESDMADHVRSAWENGVAFLEAPEGLRNRVPLLVEWKGAHGNKGDASVPADLRVDHVYLVSCKYRSKVIENTSPYNIFEASLIGPLRRSGTADWFRSLAPAEFDALYDVSRSLLGPRTPTNFDDLVSEDRVLLGKRLNKEQPDGFADRYAALIDVVATESARRWRAKLTTQSLREEMLWRMLRLQSAPYFVLGSSASGTMRYRVATPWDWAVRYKLRSFDVRADHNAGQPTVRWQAVVHDLESSADVAVDGHAEVRWTHGKFAKQPEAKLYLDTPTMDVPGYHSLGAPPQPVIDAQLPIVIDEAEHHVS